MVRNTRFFYPLQEDGAKLRIYPTPCITPRLITARPGLTLPRRRAIMIKCQQFFGQNKKKGRL